MISSFDARRLVPGIMAERSLLRQPRLAQPIKRRLQHRLVLDQPFDRELGIDTTSFG